MKHDTVMDVLDDSSGRRQYVLNLTQVQADALSFAADIVIRLYMGQTEEIKRLHMNRIFDLDQTTRDDMHKSLQRLQEIFVPGGGFHGIHNKDDVPERARILFDLHQVLRNKIAWDRNPEGGIQVWFDDPMQTSTMPLATIKDANEDG